MSSTQDKRRLPVFTIEECPACSQKTKRDFQVGDYVTKESANCTKCGNPTRISLVYAEASKPSR
jgi:rRNA maturation protein Nop10